MARRFIDTQFFKSPFVRGLNAPCKLLYSFIITDCNGAGIWAKDLEIAGVYCASRFTEEDWEKNFVETGKAVDLGGGKFFFPDFIEHQYPSGLQLKNKAHTGFISELRKYDLITEEGALKPLVSPLEGAKVMVKVLGNGNGDGNSQGKGNGLGNGKVRQTEKIESNEAKEARERYESQEAEIWPTFIDFWDLYDKKQDRKKCKEKWEKLTQVEKEAIMMHLHEYVGATPDKQYRKNPVTYLNNKTWEDEDLPLNSTKNHGISEEIKRAVSSIKGI